MRNRNISEQPSSIKNTIRGTGQSRFSTSRLFEVPCSPSRCLKRAFLSLKWEGRFLFLYSLTSVYILVLFYFFTTVLIFAREKTRYVLDGSGIESRLGRGFPHPSSPVLRSIQPPIQWVLGRSRGGRLTGRGVDHPPQSSTEVRKE